MAWPSDDRVAVQGPLLSVDEAVALVRESLPVVAGIETVGLAAADGRIAAEDIVSGLDLPRFDNSAVDGYAVRLADVAPEGNTVLPLRGRLAAGGAAAGISAAGAAVRIFTGAPLPPDADTVVMQEGARVEDGRVTLPAGLTLGANRRRAGEDVRRGDVVVGAGRRLRPQDVAIAAAVGLSEIRVRRRLRVAVFSTGTELAEPGAALAPGAVHDSNRVMLQSLLRRFGADVRDLGILRDDPDVVALRLAEAARDCDAIVTSGGVSVGEEDHVRAAVGQIGRLVFWRLAIKPGKPVAMGLVGGVPFAGLPGNPVAAYVTLLFLVGPLLARIGGARYEPPLRIPVRAAFACRRKAGRREYVRATLRERPDGSLEAVRFPRDGAGMLSSLTTSDGLVELDERLTEVAEGDTLPFLPHALMC